MPVLRSYVSGRWTAPPDGRPVRGEFLRVPKHGATAGALIRPGQSSHAIPFKNDLVKLIAAADRAGKRDVHADHTV